MKLNYTKNNIRNLKDNVEKLRKNPNWLAPDIKLNEEWVENILELIADWERLQEYYECDI